MHSNQSRFLDSHKKLSSLRPVKTNISEEIPVPIFNESLNEDDAIWCNDEEPALCPDKVVTPELSINSEDEVIPEEEPQEMQPTIKTINLPKRKMPTPTKTSYQPETNDRSDTNTVGSFETTHKRHTIYLTYPNYNKVVELKNTGKIKSSTRLINEALRIYLNNNF